MSLYILHLQDNSGSTNIKEVEAESSQEAVDSNMKGQWVKMSNNEIPRGMYRSGTYSVENGYLTVKKPNGVHDWFKKID